MKLRMGLDNIDLAERFRVSESTVTNIFLTWVNYIYIVIGSLKSWPHRDIILNNSPKDFLEKYPTNVIIVDATELQVQVPSALQKHSECYSTYKSHATLKCLIGVDPSGGVMFVSQLYESSISDKKIIQRSGFLAVLQKKLHLGEVKKGDAVMANKGFDIATELQKVGIGSTYLPFLKINLGSMKMMSSKLKP